MVILMLSRRTWTLLALHLSEVEVVLRSGLGNGVLMYEDADADADGWIVLSQVKNFSF